MANIFISVIRFHKYVINNITNLYCMADAINFEEFAHTAINNGDMSNEHYGFSVSLICRLSIGIFGSLGVTECDLRK